MIILTILGVFIGLVAVLAWRGSQVYLSVKGYAKFWQEQANRPHVVGEIKLLALGDSTMQAIGATSPMKGVVGLAAKRITELTSRPVHITNFSKTGGKIADVVNDQLPKSQGIKADIVIVSVGANDSTKQTDLAEFERDYQAMLSGLPRGKTMLGGVPFVKHRDKYEAVVQKLAKASGLPVAPIYETMVPYKNDWTTYAGDFFHPSGKGYRLWFKAFSPIIERILK